MYWSLSMFAMEDMPSTPFSSPLLTTAKLPAIASSDLYTEHVQNIGTPFCALRRSASYHAEIAPAVATIFDMMHMDDKSFNNSHDYATPHDINSIESKPLIINLHPLFERVFLMESMPKTADGHETNLQCGLSISNNIDSYLWRLAGICLTSEGRMVIYRAHSDQLLSSIFIAVPTQWSVEGLQFAKVR